MRCADSRFIYLPRWLLSADNKRLHGRDRMVLLSLAGPMTAKLTTTLPELAADLGVSYFVARNAVKSLNKKGFIAVSEDEGRLSIEVIGYDQWQIDGAAESDDGEG